LVPQADSCPDAGEKAAQKGTGSVTVRQKQGTTHRVIPAGTWFVGLLAVVWLTFTGRKQAKATSDSLCVARIECIRYHLVIYRKSNDFVLCFIECLFGSGI